MVVIQQVIVMSSQTLAQSDKAAAPPNEAEYNAVYAAVTATERGRWFLKEFADRNRSADTDLIMAAIARIEAAIAGGAAPQAAQVRDLALAAAVICGCAVAGAARALGACSTRAASPVASSWLTLCATAPSGTNSLTDSSRRTVSDAAIAATASE